MGQQQAGRAVAQVGEPLGTAELGPVEDVAVVVAANEAEVRDVQAGINVVQREAVAPFPGGHVGEVHEASVAPAAIHVAGHELSIPSDLAVGAQQVRIDAVNHRVAVMAPGQGADVARRPTAFAAGLVEQPGDAEVPAVLSEPDGGAVVPLRRPAHVILEGGQQTVAPMADLASHLDGAEQIGGPAEFGAFRAAAVRHLDARRSADAAGVEQRGGRWAVGGQGAPPEAAWPTGTDPGSGRGDEDLVALQEEQPLLRKERLEGG